MNAKRARTNYAAAADRAAPTPPKATAAGKAGRAARAPRTKPVRITLDMDPTQHLALKTWCNQAALDLGLPSVSAAPVLRALVQLLLDESDVAERVQSVLEETADR